MRHRDILSEGLPWKIPSSPKPALPPWVARASALWAQDPDGSGMSLAGYLTSSASLPKEVNLGLTLDTLSVASGTVTVPVSSVTVSSAEAPLLTLSFLLRVARALHRRHSLPGPPSLLKVLSH